MTATYCGGYSQHSVCVPVPNRLEGWVAIRGLGKHKEITHIQYTSVVPEAIGRKGIMHDVCLRWTEKKSVIARHTPPWKALNDKTWAAVCLRWSSTAQVNNTDVLHFSAPIFDSKIRRKEQGHSPTPTTTTANFVHREQGWTKTTIFFICTYSR